MPINSLRFIAIAGVILALVAAGTWLDVFRSAPLIVQAIEQQRHPADFEIEFAGAGAPVSPVTVELTYVPRTPIFGISQHYGSIISPLWIDVTTRFLEIPVRAGRIRFSAPLGLVGISNDRLVRVNIAEDAPYALVVTNQLDDPSKVDPRTPPTPLNIPHVEVNGAQLRFDGPLALWRRLADQDDNVYSYSPPYGDMPAQFIWDDLRTLRARVDLAPYPLTSFVVPAAWEGDGWKDEGYQRSRPHATLTDSTLTLRAGVSVPLPFARECEALPQFAVVTSRRIPDWSRIDGLWRPLDRAVWNELIRRAPVPGLRLQFNSRAASRASLERVESLDIIARAADRYRVFAACPNPHYGSVGVTWIDVRAVQSSL